MFLIDNYSMKHVVIAAVTTVSSCNACHKFALIQLLVSSQLQALLSLQVSTVIEHEPIRNPRAVFLNLL